MPNNIKNRSDYMLIQYSVINYKSIKDELCINFSAINQDMDEKKLLTDDGLSIPIYKCVGLVGPNASGKTNIIDSLFFALKFINSTIQRKEKSRINVESFMLDAESREKGTSFEFIFFEDGVKYVYGFTINTEKILEEYLQAYYSRKPTTIFDRDAENDEEYNFRGNDVKLQVDIAKKTNGNRLYLPVAAEWGYEKAKIPYGWFGKMFRQYGNMNISDVIASTLENDRLKPLLLKTLNKADFNIVDVYVKKKKLQKEHRDVLMQIFKQMLGEGELESDLIPENRSIIWVKHKGKDGELFDIELDDDSSGTGEIIDNLAEFLFINEEGGLIIEDELGRNFHTKLTEFFIELFNDNSLNVGKAQMLFCTHDTRILNLLSPEQIYLVDKDDGGATYVKLLDDYLIRKKDNIELGYLKGRYGAIPNIEG